MKQHHEVEGTLQSRKNDIKSYCFLIGGYDLEMVTIIDLLKKYLPEGRICDRELKWGACLSSYQDLLNDNDVFIGIELDQDINPPPNYIEIDHHNENREKPSSLNQIIQFLKETFYIEVEITRHIELVSANDTGYIPAMLAIGATREEIAKIRHLDRQAQGVGEEDERLAEKSIRENLTTEKGITIVKSLTSKFSTITDRLYPCNRLLIYTNDELNYFGEGTRYLIDAFDELIKEGKAYFGGAGEGFFGLTSEGIWRMNGSKAAINQIINHIGNGK